MKNVFVVSLSDILNSDSPEKITDDLPEGIQELAWGKLSHSTWVMEGYKDYVRLHEILHNKLEESTEALKTFINKLMNDMHGESNRSGFKPCVENLDSTLFHNLAYYVATGLVDNDPEKEHFLMLIDDPMMDLIYRLEKLQ